MNIIYHSRDIDGYCSGAICKKKYPEAKLIGFDYGQGLQKILNEVKEGEPVIMVDVSLPMFEMMLLAEHTKRQLTWIDHHASAIKDFNEYFIENDNLITPILEDGIAACEGTWKYLYPNIAMPEVVELLGKYDTWRNQDIEDWNDWILPFQYGMRMECSSPETFPEMLLRQDTRGPLTKIKDTGKVILAYQREQNQIAMRGSFDIEFEGLRILACNGCGFNSHAFESKWDEEKYDAMMPFKYDGSKWTFSLYTTKDIDLSVIAKKHGGGGHKKACGFMVESIPDFLFNRN